MELNKIYPLVIAIILSGIILGVGVLVMQNFEDAELVSTAVTDENITLLNGTAVDLTYDRLVSVSTVQVNGTTTISSGNYTVGSTGLEGTEGTITLTSGATYNNSWALINYTYNADSSASASIDDAEGAISGFASDWLPIIIIAAAASIVLFIIIGALGRRK